MKTSTADQGLGISSFLPKMTSDVVVFERPTSSHTRSKTNVERVRRQSLFDKRSRSDTIGSNSTSSSSMQSQAVSSMTSFNPESRRGSVQDPSQSCPAPWTLSGTDKMDPTAKKSLLARGSRILRRQGSKFSISASLEEEEESKTDVSNLLQRRQRSKARQSSTQSEMKGLISEPFNFQHLTHTQAAHFQELEKVSRNDLVTEFSAIRASQKPQSNLKGIRAEALHFRGLSSESLQSPRQRSSSANSTPTSPMSPSSPGYDRNASRGHQRQRKSIENFSRPIARSPPTQSTASFGGRRRKSSTAVLTDVNTDPSAQTIDAILDSYDGSHAGFAGISYPNSPHGSDGEPAVLSMSGLFSPDSESDSECFHYGHAITADESTDLRSSPTNPSDLADVPEEDETPGLDLGSSVKGTGRRPHRATVKQARSLPRMKLSFDQTRPTFKNPFQFSGQMSPDLEVLRSPVETRWGQTFSPPQAATGSKRFSVGLKSSFEGSWEDDIDYCYEHAAESNCDFEWDRPSLDAGEEFGAQLRNEAANSVASRSLGAPFGYALSSANSEPTSAQTVSTMTLPTPEISVSSSSSNKNSYFGTTPALTIRTSYPEMDMSHEALYDEYLANNDSDENRFHMFHENGISSPRTSSLFSKCNSQESVILSRAASVVRKHRSSVSSGSIPDLVHSVCGSNDYTETDALNEPSSPVPASPVHRRSKSLAKEVAHHNLLKKSSSNASAIEDAETQMPISRKNSRVSYSIFPDSPRSHFGQPF